MTFRIFGLFFKQDKQNKYAVFGGKKNYTGWYVKQCEIHVISNTKLLRQTIFINFFIQKQFKCEMLEDAL